MNVDECFVDGLFLVDLVVSCCGFDYCIFVVDLICLYGNVIGCCGIC